MRFKTASVTPLLKKTGLDREEFSNYRPISNLHTISKIIERIAMSRLVDHVERSPSYNRFQSAYRRCYSTETATIRLLNDVYRAADDGSRTLLLQLDLSAAFDTIDKNPIRALRHIRKRVSETVALTIASSMVGARIDYCNAVLFGTTKSNIQKLQRVQNSLARIVTGSTRSEQIKPVLARLHWLTIAECIEYKVVLITFKVVTTHKKTSLSV